VLFATFEVSPLSDYVGDWINFRQFNERFLFAEVSAGVLPLNRRFHRGGSADRVIMSSESLETIAFFRTSVFHSIKLHHLIPLPTNILPTDTFTIFQ